MSNQISTKRGDSWQLTWAWRDANGDPIDLSGCSAQMQLKQQLGSEPVLDLLSSGEGLTIDSSAGDVSVSVDAATMSTLTPGIYHCDMQLTFPDGRVVSTATIQVYVETDITT